MYSQRFLSQTFRQAMAPSSTESLASTDYDYGGFNSEKNFRNFNSNYGLGHFNNLVESPHLAMPQFSGSNSYLLQRNQGFFVGANNPASFHFNSNNYGSRLLPFIPTKSPSPASAFWNNQQFNSLSSYNSSYFVEYPPSPASSLSGNMDTANGSDISVSTDASDEDFDTLWNDVCTKTATIQVTPAEEMPHRSIRGRGLKSGTNMTCLRTPIPLPLCYKPLTKPKNCVFCVKVNPELAKTHNMKEQNRVVCPSLRAYQCPICGTPDKDRAHTVRFCPKNQY